MSSLTSTPTMPSLDAFSDFDYSLLSESLSLDTISIASLESVPPFPYGCMVPFSTFLAVNDCPCTPANPHPDALPTITTTIPTPPRLRTLLKEDLCISRWTESLVAADAPGHTPWGEIKDNDVLSSWKPEGSLYPSDTFQQALTKSRQRAPTTRRLSPHPNANYRSALVFEHEITLESEGGTKRWSVQVPAGSMNPDLVDMMVELRDLKSYFKEEDEDLQKKEEKREDQLNTTVDNVYAHPPSFIVSNSHSALPLSLESIGSLHSAPKSLAMRRGNKSLPSLSLNVEVMDPNSYPSIPTAFLGSPSSYRPTFEFVGDARSSADFQDMIDSLRSQCASLQVKPASCPALQEEGLFTTFTPPDPLPSPDADDCDDWAFAESLLEKFPEFCVEVRKASIAGVAQEPEEIYPEATLLVTDPGSLNDTPYPPSPSIISVSPTLSSNSPRGILKRCKSVRFAESPLEDQASENATPAQEAPTPVRHSMGPPTRVLKRPSPLRSTYAPRRNAASLDPTPPSLRDAGRQKPPMKALAPSVDTPKPPVQLLRRATTKPAPQRTEGTVSSPDKQKQKTQDTPSLGRSFRNTLIPGKENKKVKAKISFSSNRHTMDENALRRACNKAPQKSRMPVPLRNIFTKFK
ncbi:hypothetical protein BT96DRAFT_975836 [Gymnopus androsaceus JB14]|uniref:Uncharacterized protein n=1 Tax=Gymnopus androsaceus JB14 TaxID=1447944 RepID=A0A6A4HQD2_9AGAR|nr:hypothetical protein BT96DRAFT_975836 [Gymnopus androsaceus JB14]